MSGPSLDQYPGFFPAAKRPFWSRAKVGTATGIAGILLGVGIGAGSGEQPVSADNPEVKALVKAGVDERTSNFDDQSQQLEEQVQKLEDDVALANKDAEAAAAAAHHTLAATKKAAAKAQKKAVQAAVAAEKAKHVAPPPTYGLAGGGSSGGSSSGGGSGGSDPIFGTCGEANDNGYGPYRQGVDPEYAYYDDRDHDGLVCEP